MIHNECKVIEVHLLDISKKKSNSNSMIDTISIY